MNSAWQTWLRCPQPRPGVRVLLVCCPHAGGSASFFYPWTAGLHRSVELVAVQYPGREDRADEPCVDDLGSLADHIADALGPVRGHPFALLGHSMGALVAYEVALRMQRRWDTVPSRLFVSGSPAPGCQPPDADCDDEWADEELVMRLRKWGRTDPVLLAQPELRKIALSALRADLRLLRTYRAEQAGVVTCPVTGLVGDRDPEASISSVRGWARLTQDRFDLRVFSGDHFYLVPRQDELLIEVLHRLGVHSSGAAWWSTP